MAGLIQQQMPGAPAQDPMAEDAAMQDQVMGMPGSEEMDEEGGPDESNPVFQQALGLAYEALYAKEAAIDVAKTLRAGGSLPDAMADVAYNITSIIDERTDGQVPDELLIPLAMSVLEEVAEIADAANLNPQPEDVATAFKTMILRYLAEQGLDTTELQAAMDQVDPSEFRRMAQAE